MKRSRAFVPDLRAESLLERFFVSAVSAILVLRLYLYLTGFPQVGGKGLHISHMLWGGLLMLAGSVMMMYFLDRTAHGVAAVLSGAGFGIFIDELGKFVTSNNNYFFKPATSIIYVIFVLLYLLFWALGKHRRLHADAYLINALKEVQQAIVHGDPVRHRARVRHYVSRTDAASPVAASVLALSDSVSQVAGKSPATRMRRIRVGTASRIDALLEEPLFQTVMTGVLILQAIGTVLEAVIVAAVTTHHRTPQALVEVIPYLPFSQAANLLSSLGADVVVLLGILAFARSRLLAYRIFKIAVLISLLVTQVFVFDLIQFWALIGFAVDFLLIGTLSVIIREEETHALRAV